MKMEVFVMPAGIAGIQLRKDASGDIHVDIATLGFQHSMLE